MDTYHSLSLREGFVKNFQIHLCFKEAYPDRIFLEWGWSYHH